MNANEITFGIEIETTIPRGIIPVGGYFQGTAVEGMPAGWTAKHDGSIRTTGRRQGCEFVSPVLKGADGLRQVVQVVARINELGGKVNDSCGLHVHVGMVNDSAAVARLVTLTANFEKAIYASTGTKRRERGNYTRPVSVMGTAQAAIASQSNRSHGDSSRYRILNLVNLLNGTAPAVEFRAFAGTLNVAKIIGHIRMCIGMVERAVSAKRITTWTAKAPVASSPIHRSGEGQTHLTRLFYQLGWTKGRTKETFGNVEAEGVPSLRNSKRTLMGLARKYDAQR